jgi:2-keto-4-pentenoate hydratase
VDAQRVANSILAARRRGALLEAPLIDGPVGLAEAYAVQNLVVQARVDAGERIVGWKLGYTSEAMRRQMGIDEPNLGPLTDAMMLVSGATLPEAGLLHPRVEPEIVLIAGATRPGTERDPDSVAAAVTGARAALEVVDSVFQDYRFRLEDNTADGSSAAYAVLGPELPFEDELVDLRDTRVTLKRNGQPCGVGVGRDAMGGPFEALRWLVTALADGGRQLVEGDIVLTGGLSAAVPLEPGDVVHADFDRRVVSITRADPGRPR